ncbi:hypothetical protein JYT31_02770 [Beggiatoa alba]|nr:hypothetical protein [Beggiatoa alba]
MYPGNTKLQDFASQQHLQGITEHTLEAIIHSRAGYSIEKGQQFIHFYERIKKELLLHPVITSNEFTAWFSEGNINKKQLEAFVVQFSVFSNLFIVAQLLKTINADSLEAMRASKEILVNELGVVFHTEKKSVMDKTGYRDTNNFDENAQLVSAEGTVDGGRFHFQAAHFEWLLKLSGSIGLSFSQVGKRHLGSESTLFFCDELNRLYANEDYTISQASSFAVENWAAAGFWKELIQGLEAYQVKHAQKLPIFFFTRHDAIEAQHAQHTLDELEDIYFEGHLDEDLFIDSGNEMLHAVDVFWKGLNSLRLSLDD